ncbi:unnamed protein product [marine sediment metagenome]|uniref:Dinitrogenase iron-molybdenum cofactor biosynthesis domain-containing protein n=1 Tax=marine sediment metagenome TaxID=412755 RepID=X1AD06_9ZZZZ
MKIAITSMGAKLEDKVDPRFGRCRYFILSNHIIMLSYLKVNKTRHAVSLHWSALQYTPTLNFLSLKLLHLKYTLLFSLFYT